MMRPFIENVSYDNIKRAFHYDPGPNSVLIQITDPNMSGFPFPKYKFKEIHQFKFWDQDEEGYEGNFTREQAKEIVHILKSALDNHSNVIVHCHAGMCRSGAVVEAGISIGFMETDRYRQPNILVKRLLMEQLNET